jgi:hypothetical protein
MKHLVVLVHGLNGEAADLGILGNMLTNTGLPGVEVMISKVNQCSLTYDGIDAGGNRLALEIIQYFEKTAPTSFSIIGHSLGGVYARYAIGVLEREHWFEKIRPHTYISLCSPHVGSRRGKGVYNFLASIVARYCLSKTGSQLMLDDDPDQPLLLEMTNPDSVWMTGLEKFPRKLAYACIANDAQVNYCTAAIKPRNMYLANPTELKMSLRYPCIVEPYPERGCTIQKISGMLPHRQEYNETVSTIDHPHVEQILENLNQLNWIRVDIWYPSIRVHEAVICKGLGGPTDILEHIVDQILGIY